MHIINAHSVCHQIIIRKHTNAVHKILRMINIFAKETLVCATCQGKVATSQCSLFDSHYTNSIRNYSKPNRDHVVPSVEYSAKAESESVCISLIKLKCYHRMVVSERKIHTSHVEIGIFIKIIAVCNSKVVRFILLVRHRLSCILRVPHAHELLSPSQNISVIIFKIVVIRKKNLWFSLQFVLLSVSFMDINRLHFHPYFFIKYCPGEVVLINVEKV